MILNIDFLPDNNILFLPSMFYTNPNTKVSFLQLSRPHLCEPEDIVFIAPPAYFLADMIFPNTPNKVYLKYICTIESKVVCPAETQ